jgi:hypothetical protein
MLLSVAKCCGDNQGEVCLPAFVSCITCTTSFDLWMSRVGHDTFVMVVNFLNDYWEPSHVTMGIFEVQNTIGATMVN